MKKTIMIAVMSLMTLGVSLGAQPTGPYQTSPQGQQFYQQMQQNNANSINQQNPNTNQPGFRFGPTQPNPNPFPDQNS
jgi:hypothetical protein